MRATAWLAAVALAAAPAAAPEKDASAEAARLRRRVEQLKRERDLASGKAFYLRVDAARRQLALMLNGVRLDVYAASGLECGVPQVAFVERRPAPDWDTAAFSKGRLSPERERDRLEVVAPAPAPKASPAPGDKSPSPPPVPKSAEETYSVPSPYRIVFAEGVSLEIRSAGGARNRSLLQRSFDAVRRHASDLRSALAPATGERVRLRVTLEPDDAASLYRSLPPEVGMIVVGLPPSF
jgi:hypothetical protein